MVNEDRIAARAPQELLERIESVAERYDMDHSKVVRLLVRNGLDRVERHGLDAVASDETQPEEQPAD